MITAVRLRAPYCQWLLGIATILLLVFPVIGHGEVTNNGNPWDRSFLTSPPSALLSAASAVPASESDGILVLLDEGTFSFDADGRCTSRYRLAYRVLNRSGLEAWSSIAAVWTPWNQERPMLTARVVTPDGVEHVLPPETIDDSPASENSPNIYSDRRMLRAPLPALTVGAVVEQEIVIREKEPYFPAGSTHRFYFGCGVRVLNARVVIESPAALPMRHVVRLCPQAAVTETRADGRSRLTIESGPLAALEPIEAGLPGDVTRWPHVAFTTGRGWAEVAARYGEIVESRIAPGDLGNLVKEAVGDARKRELVAARLLERLQREVRYTGLEFGSSSIVPTPPEETLRRKFGDCKDQSALLIKLLRAAGIPAHMALVRSGMGEDVDEELPGLGDFDHAIVYIPGAPAIWIDPTDNFLPAGELPLHVQGRRALIAGGSFSGLLETPETPSTGNRQLETREFFLAEQGKSRVIETTLAWGSIGASYARDYRDADEKTIRDRLGEYVRTMYLADGISAVENIVPERMGEPFLLRLKMEQASRGLTDEDEAAVALSASFLTERLPAQLIESGSQANEARLHDFLIAEPYVYEARYHIVPPPGFTARELPESGTIRLGSLSLAREFRLEKDGSVAAVLRFDTGKRRLTPAEFEEARKSLQGLNEEKATLIRFRQTGRALLAEGKYREALAEFRRLAKLHPAEALHYNQLAMALIESGLGSAARRAAEQAVALEPDSAAAHRTLAWVLQHDAVGRLRGKGFDRDRAIAEYRKAKALDPDDFLARADLAILLEFNGRGERYSRDANLAEAIEEYRAIRTDFDHAELDDNLLLCLFRSERWKELKEIALSLEPSETRTSFILLALAGEGGAVAAMPEFRRLVPDPAGRRQTLITVAASLIQVRRYRDAAALLREAAKGAPRSAALETRISLLERINPVAEHPLSDETPPDVIKRMFLAFFSPGSTPDDFLSLFASPVREEIGKSGSDLAIGRMMDYYAAQTGKGEIELPREVIADFTLGIMEFHMEGNDADGYRIDLSMPSFKKGNLLRIYAIREEGKYRIVTVSTAPNVIGLEVMRRLGAGDLEGARRWLDWARDEISPESGDDPPGEVSFPRVWAKGAAADKGRMQLAAACLLADIPHSRVIPILLQEQESAGGELREAIHSALATAYLAQEQYPDLLRLCDRLSSEHPLSPFVFMMRVRALKAMDRPQDAATLAADRLLKLPKDPEALRVLANCSEHLGKLAKAEAYYRLLVKEGAAMARDYNNLAWLGLFGEAGRDEYLVLAERAAALGNGANPASLNTLSALYADTGKTAEAREAMLKSMEISGMNEPSSADWYILGRIAEQYGETEAAIEAYGKVDKPGRGAAAANSVHALAGKRLQLLAGKGGDT